MEIRGKNLWDIQVANILSMDEVLLTINYEFNRIIEIEGETIYNKMTKITFTLKDEYNMIIRSGTIRLTYTDDAGKYKFYSLDEENKCFPNILLLAKYIYGKLQGEVNHMRGIPLKVALSVYMMYL